MPGLLRDHGGIHPSHHIFLSENSRPAWILAGENFLEGKKNITWIPTLENMLEDALLMVAIYVLKNSDVREKAEKYFNKELGDWIELYEDIEKNKLAELYKMCREIEYDCKLVVTAFEGSSIGGQLKILEEYSMDIEVCTAIYSRFYSEWREETVIDGSL